MKVLLISFFISGSLFAFSQVDYVPYHHKINSAEIHYLEQKYEEALVLYMDAFNLVPYVFAKDYTNASLLCMQLHNYEQAAIYLDSALIRNTNIKWIKKSVLFDAFKESIYGKRLLQRLDTIYSIRDKRLNLKQKKEFNKISKIDQKNRSFYNRTFNKKNWIRKDSINFINFIKLTQKYGFPCEKNLGVDNYVNYLNSTQIVILHNISSYKAKDSLISLMKGKVVSGELLPESFAWIVDRCLVESKANYEKYGTFSFYSFQLASNYFPNCKKQNKDILSELNNNRKLIGLESYEINLKRKKLMAQKEITLF